MRVLTVRHTLGMSQLLNNHTSLLLGNESYIINGGDLPIRNYPSLANSNLLICSLGQQTPPSRDTRESVLLLAGLALCGTCFQRIRRESAGVQLETLQLS